MSWNRTRAWWHTVLDVVSEIEQRRDGELPWREGYAEVFGDERGLIGALGYYWRETLEAQVDTEADLTRVVAEHGGLQLVLDRFMRTPAYA